MVIVTIEAKPFFRFSSFPNSSSNHHPMPRRPRPTSRAPPDRAPQHTRRSQISNSEDKTTPSSSDGSDSEIGEEEEDDPSEVTDMDAPRVAQWEDESDVQSEDESSEPVSGPSNWTRLEDDLSQLPLGALRTAQQTLAQGEAEDSDEDWESDNESEAPSAGPSKPEKVEWSIKPKKDIAKRANKHAPTEVTSKRPVPRRKVVVEVKQPESRDPRFLPVTGELNAQKFHQNYHFLAESRKSELGTLKENLKRARKLLANSPRALREEREAEVQRLEHAVKRTESLVNRDRREKVEENALNTARKEESEKRKSGKGSWWMKDADKKKLLTKARYDALAEEGGNRAVKKAIAKKQKKIGQKEKRSRPFSRDGGQGGRPNKRQRIS